MREHVNTPEKKSHTIESNPRASRQAPISEILQTYKNNTLGKQPVQREIMDDEELLQAKSANTTQCKDLQLEEEEPLQMKPESATPTGQGPIQQEEKPNNTGLPDNLKTGIENVSGYSMDDVTVHYNSDKPAQLNALAYTQGTDIHVAPGQEQHLPHEAWHIVQQKQGRVQPTTQLQGVNVNDDEGLEKEADEMGATIQKKSIPLNDNKPDIKLTPHNKTIQRVGEKKFTLKKSGDNNGEYENLNEKINEAKQTRRSKKQEFITEKLGDRGALYYFKLKLKQLSDETLKPEEQSSLTGKDNLKLDQTELQNLDKKNDLEKEIKTFVMTKYPESLRFNIIEDLKPSYTFNHEGKTLDTIGDLEDKPYTLSIGSKEFATLLVGDSAFTQQEKATEREIYKRDDKEYIKDDKGVFTRRYAYVEKNLYQFMDFLNMGKMIGRYELLNMALGVESDELRKKNRELTDAGKKRLLTDPMQTNPEQIVDGATAIAVQHQWMGTGLQQRGLSLASTPKEAVISNDGDSFKSDDGVRIKIDLAKIPEYKKDEATKNNPMLINHYASGGIKDEAKGIKPSVLKNEQPEGEDKMRYHYINSVTKNRELFLEFLKPEWIEDVTFHGKMGEKETVTLEEFMTKCKEIIQYSEYETGVHSKIKPDQPDLASSSDKTTKGQGYGKLYTDGYDKGKEICSILKATKGEQQLIAKSTVLSKSDKNIIRKNTTTIEKDFFYIYFSDNANKDKTDVERIGFAHGLMGGVKKDSFNGDFYKLTPPPPIPASPPTTSE